MFNLKTIGVKLAFNAKYREKVWRKLATQLGHGLPFYRCIENLHARSEAKGKVVALAYAQLLENNALGGSLEQGLEPLASPSEIMIIAAGEKENLAQGLILAADLLKNQGRIKKEVIQSTAYPCFLLMLLAALMLIIANILVPQFAAILPTESFSGAAKILLHLADFVSSWLGFAVFILGVFFCFLVYYSLPRLTGSLRCVLDKWVPWSIYREVVGASFLYTLGLMMSLGIKPREIFAWLLASNAQTAYLKERVAAIDLEMALGRNLGQAMDEAGYDFPAENVIDDLIVYGALPNFDKQIAVIAREELEECVSQIEKKLKIFQIVLLFLIVGLILFVLVALSSMQETLGYMQV